MFKLVENPYPEPPEFPDKYVVWYDATKNQLAADKKQFVEWLREHNLSSDNSLYLTAITWKILQREAGE